MTLLRWHAEEDASVAHALALGRGALAAVGGHLSAVVVSAALRGDARVLGAYQRAEDAVRSDAPILRRETGGPAVVAGEGVLYLALALQGAGALMACPRDRVLNRNVRPILGALRRLHADAHYFGREFVSVDRRPAALVGWTRRPSGAVLIEAFAGVDRPYALPDAELALTPSAPRMLGKVPITLAEAMRAPPTARALAEACAAACASMTPLDLDERAIAPDPSLPADERPMRWSSPREVPIGFLRAGLALDAHGVMDDARLAGDFFQDADAPARLRAALVGGEPTPTRLRDALNATYGKHGAVIEGLRTLQPALDAFLELADR